MDRGAWWATVHGVAESDTTERLLLLLWPHRRQPTRLPLPWDSPGKNTGVGCHFLLQYMKVKSESEVAQSCLTPNDGLQPTRLLHPWDFPGKSTGVGCHCLLRLSDYAYTKPCTSCSKHLLRTSLVSQWLRICHAMQGTWVQSLVKELRSPHAVEQLSPHVTTREARAPTTTTEPISRNRRAHAPRQKVPYEAMEFLCAAIKTQHNQIKVINFFKSMVC